MTTRILVIGASGQLGRALCRVFGPDYEIIGTAHQRAEAGQRVLDLGDAAAVRAVVEAARPAVVLLAGALCNVDLCEMEPERCRRVNVDGPRAVAESAARTGARVVLFSTDHVFDGRRDGHVESDPVNPLNEYARSKAAGEALLREVLPDRHLVIRTAWLFGPDAARRNFALRFVDRARAGERIAVPHDQWGCPTYTEDVAHATRSLVDRESVGTFHATGPDFIDRVSLARRLCAHFGLDEAVIVPTPTRALHQAAPRPARVRVDCHKLETAGVPRFRSLDASIRALRDWELTRPNASVARA